MLVEDKKKSPPKVEVKPRKVIDNTKKAVE